MDKPLGDFDLYTNSTIYQTGHTLDPQNPSRRRNTVKNRFFKNSATFLYYYAAPIVVVLSSISIFLSNRFITVLVSRRAFNYISQRLEVEGIYGIFPEDTESGIVSLDYKVGVYKNIGMISAVLLVLLVSYLIKNRKKLMELYFIVLSILPFSMGIFAMACLAGDFATRFYPPYPANYHLKIIYFIVGLFMGLYSFLLLVFFNERYKKTTKKLWYVMNMNVCIFLFGALCDLFLNSIYRNRSRTLLYVGGSIIVALSFFMDYNISIHVVNNCLIKYLVSNKHPEEEEDILLEPLQTGRERMAAEESSTAASNSPYIRWENKMMLNMESLTRVKGAVETQEMVKNVTFPKELHIEHLAIIIWCFACSFLKQTVFMADTIVSPENKIDANSYLYLICPIIAVALYYLLASITKAVSKILAVAYVMHAVGIVLLFITSFIGWMPLQYLSMGIYFTSFNFAIALVSGVLPIALGSRTSNTFTFAVYIFLTQIFDGSYQLTSVLPQLESKYTKYLSFTVVSILSLLLIPIYMRIRKAETARKEEDDDDENAIALDTYIPAVKVDTAPMPPAHQRGVLVSETYTTKAYPYTIDSGSDDEN
ncbi:hypothetical protein NEMIN01_1259 [Nematocida minor]|uniref:uncharacterized protein n=1 Tax=Nematocida minor TaxID=1912983 RepID=UPI00221E52E6|nr:uncharacterized protein NEMIN01_1259 [Nematocida minor]KAI5190857.1 hypothetical protein NEMIN01_1259 [Nematocida minor]